jgi:uncharacterized repeat protein (TIGR02543 family)
MSRQRFLLNSIVIISMIFSLIPMAVLAAPAINGAPTISLVQPANGATGVSTSPTLEVTVTDPESDPTTVSFYGRVKSAPQPDFMLVLIPDPQNESQYNVNMFKAQTNWMVANKAANNIAFVTAAGDMVNTSNSTTEYGNADSAVDILDAGGVWYTMAPGNHDNPGYASPLLYPNYFGASRYVSRTVALGYWFGGSYDDYNTYSLFSAGGMDFILINLKYNPSTEILNWAEGLMNTYSTRRVIVESHSILNVNNSFTAEGTTIYNALRDHNNLFLMLCGHMHSGSDGAAYVAGTGTGGAGQTIHIVQADYQDMSYGNGYLRLFRFSPSANMIYMNTYSPYTNGYITSTSNFDTVNLAYTMTLSQPYTLIGTVTGVTSGSNPTVTWPSLAYNQAYEWYAVASDGVLTTTSATWTFTTTVTPTCYPLTLGHTGQGSDPVAAPTKSAVCTTNGTYVAGESISLSGAAPGPGWQISGWSGTSNDASTAETNSLTMPAGPRTASVNYTQIPYTLTINTVGNGTVAKDPNKSTYTSGEVVTLTATPDSGYVFDGWSGALSGSTNPTTITMDGNKVITATFLAEVTRTLSSGWNLLALPLQPVTTTLTAQGLLDSLNAQSTTGNCTEVDQWGLSGWVGYLDGMGFDDFAVSPGQGYFVACTTVFDWHLQGHSIQSSVPVPLAVGWNLMSVPYPTTYMAQSLLDAIAADGGSCTEVDQWGLTGWVGYLDGMGFDEFAIAPDQGYFVNCTTSGTFTP